MADWKEKARQRIKEASQGSKFTPGPNNTVRILPNKKGPMLPPFAEFLRHTEVGPDKKMVACGKDFETREGACYLCDVKIPKLESSPNRASHAVAEAMKAEEACIFQVAVYDPDSDHWSGPLTWYLKPGGGKSLWAQVMGLVTSTRRSYDDPKKGYNINFTRTGEGMKTRYGALEPDDEPSPADPDVLKKLKDFSELLPTYSQAEQQAALAGKEYVRDEEEGQEPSDEDVPPPEDEDADVPPEEVPPPEEDEESGDEEEEDETESVEIEEEEEEEEEEEPPPPPPVKKPAVKTAPTVKVPVKTASVAVKTVSAPRPVVKKK